MFTGIVEKLGRVVSLEKAKNSSATWIQTGYSDLMLGESIAINGVCLTVAAIRENDQAQFFISPETLTRTNLSSLAAGTVVNLERALALGSRLSGHWVQGHVDGQAVLTAVDSEGESYSVVFELGAEMGKYCVEKGSISLNGVSLTINEIKKVTNGRTQVRITLIPHTWKNTNLSVIKVGQSVNVEVDLMAKYLEQLCQPYHKPSMPSETANWSS